jgi:hypothetical protein
LNLPVGILKELILLLSKILAGILKALLFKILILGPKYKLNLTTNWNLALPIRIWNTYNNWGSLFKLKNLYHQLTLPLFPLKWFFGGQVVLSKVEPLTCLFCI